MSSELLPPATLINSHTVERVVVMRITLWYLYDVCVDDLVHDALCANKASCIYSPAHRSGSGSI